MSNYIRQSFPFAADLLRLRRKIRHLDGEPREDAIHCGAHFVRRWCAGLDHGEGCERIDDGLDEAICKLEDELLGWCPVSTGRDRLLENLGRLRKCTRGGLLKSAIQTTV